jgi:hypothetical protein
MYVRCVDLLTRYYDSSLRERQRNAGEFVNTQDAMRIKLTGFLAALVT